MPRRSTKADHVPIRERLVKKTTMQELVPGLHVSDEFFDEFDQECKRLLKRAAFRCRERYSKKLERSDV